MKKSKQTKRALIPSVLAVIMCVAMLIGTTFAWFTDTASTSVNKVQAGTLDVKLLDAKGNELDGNKKLSWVKATGAPETEVLWEPNCTYDLDTFQIQNAGSLALKYKVVLKANTITKNGDKSLLDVLEWTVKAGNTAIKEGVLFSDLGAENGLTIIDGEKLTKDSTVTISVSAHMKADAGNEYQGLSIDGFGVTVYAAQVNEEYDSTGNTYDIQAPYDSSAPKTPLVVKVGTAAELQAALNVFSQDSAGTNVVELTQDFDVSNNWTSVHLSGYQRTTDVTINGNGHKITSLNAPLFEGGFAGNGTLTINNLTIENPNISVSSSMGVGAFFGTADNMKRITLNNCHVTGGSIENTNEADSTGYAGGLIGYSSTSVTLTNCSVTGCKITGTNSVGGFIGHLAGASTISGTVTNCTITGGRVDKTGIILGTANSDGITITAADCSGNKAGSTPSDLTNIVGRFMAKNATLTVNGTSHTHSGDTEETKNENYTSNRLN